MDKFGVTQPAKPDAPEVPAADAEKGKGASVAKDSNEGGGSCGSGCRCRPPE